MAARPTTTQTANGAGHDGRPVCGVLALQGDFAAHAAMVEAAGAAAREVRRPAQLDGCCGLVIPGGESTALDTLLDFEDMRGAIARFHAAGGALFGTCAGVILLAREIADHGERRKVRPFGLLDVTVARNDYGRQRESFETFDAVRELGDARFPMAFIRAPRIVRAGRDVRVLATQNGDPVLVRQGRIVGCTFHPEISGDPRLHAYFLREVAGATPVPVP